jgi:hypothetical protein
MITQVSLEDEFGEEYIEGDAYIVFKEDLIEDGLDSFHFKLTGKTLEFDHDWTNEEVYDDSVLFACKYKNNDVKSFRRYDVIFIQDNVLYVQHPDINISWEITPEAGNETKRILEEYIKSQARERGRQLIAINTLPLNHNTPGVIASFLTGNEGSLNSQINKQKQKAGISLAPRPRKLRKSRKVRKSRKL